MNRENKRKTFEKGYYKTHPCGDTFTCKACGWPVGPEGAGSGHRNHCPNCLTSLHLDDNPMKLLSIAARPMASPPFPIEHLHKLAGLWGDGIPE